MDNNVFAVSCCVLINVSNLPFLK